ncbi:chromosome segregation protein SMC [Stigmatella sp. ncwal1]|uniref:Chromosome segregation protein SMC n=1 Tax=Stigmatella ashevillensis TaxID=2995309 RepID=A0ABT5D1L4_9BACT|nr:chromosome segregation protein SMC [Stigmatella ashevillena]MDC0706970.1 chromosome segregation protein SMC [Stigmatella ashevillena]
MHFVEVAIQNVRGFSAQGRFALKPGYLVLKPPTSDVSPLAGLALALFYADGRGGDASFSASSDKPGKAAFTFVGQDSQTYRLLRELGGSGTLHKQTAPGQPPELISQDSAEIGQFLRAQAGLPSRTTLEQVYCLMPGHLPSRRPRLRTSRPDLKRPSVTSGSALASNQAVTPAEDIPAAEAKVRDLEKEMVRSREVDELQFKLDGLNSQLFETERKLNSTEGLKVAVRDAEAAWNAAPTPEALGLPADIAARVERYPKARSRRDDALNRLAVEREQEAQSVPAEVESLKDNRQFWAGLGGGVLLLVLGIVLGSVLDSAWRYLVLLDIPAFGWAAMLALRYVDDLSRTTNVGRKEGMFAAREKKIIEEFEADSAHVRKALKILELEEPADIPAVFERKGLLEQKVQELRDQLSAMEASPDFLAANEQREDIKRQIEEVSAQIGKIGTYVRDVRDVEREISRTKESIALAKAPPQAGFSPGGGPGFPAEPLEDPSPVLMAQAADLLATDIPTVQGQLKDRCLQYLTALTDRRYQSVEWDNDGRGYVLSQGRHVPVGEMMPKDLDLYYLALRLTVVEKASVRVKYPFLLEHPFLGVEEVKLQLLGRMLKHLGTLTQVVHVTGHPGFAQLSDSTVNL